MEATLEIQMHNETVRVMKWTIQPGEHIPMHEHEYEYVVVPIVDGTVAVTSKDGSVQDFEMRAGVSYTRPKGTVHELKNNTSETVVFVEVEVL